MYANAQQLLKRCPQKDLLYPCICQEHNEWDSQTMLYCGGTEEYDYELLFNKLSKHLFKNEKHFDWFYLNNTQITGLSESFFSDIKFSN